jgi:hypothetical protein
MPIHDYESLVQEIDFHMNLQVILIWMHEKGSFLKVIATSICYLIQP